MMESAILRIHGESADMMKLSIVPGLFLCCEMFMVIVTSWYVHEHHEEHYFVMGVVENITSGIGGSGSYVIELQVNGDKYEIMRPSNEFNVLPYDFGVQSDNALEAMDALEMRLWGDIGLSASSLQIGSWGSRSAIRST